MEDLTDTWSHGVDRYPEAPQTAVAWSEPYAAASGPVMASLVQMGRLGQSSVLAEYRVYHAEPFVELRLAGTLGRAIPGTETYTGATSGDYSPSGRCAGGRYLAGTRSRGAAAAGLDALVGQRGKRCGSAFARCVRAGRHATASAADAAAAARGWRSTTRPGEAIRETGLLTAASTTFAFGSMRVRGCASGIWTTRFSCCTGRWRWRI